jgi:hypothetical protein
MALKDSGSASTMPTPGLAGLLQEEAVLASAGTRPLQALPEQSSSGRTRPGLLHDPALEDLNGPRMI